MNNRKHDILTNLRNVIGGVYEMDVNDVNVDITFLEMGLDSISIIQVRQLVKNQYKLDISVNRLFDDISSLDKLADFIDIVLPAEANTEISDTAVEMPVVETPILQPSLQSTEYFTELAHQPSGNVDLQSIINSQLQIMAKQIEIISKFNINV